MKAVTSSIHSEQLAWFGVNFSTGRVLTVRSLCGMQTTGDRVTPLSVGLPDAWRMSAHCASSVFRSGGPELNCRFQAFAPARGVFVR